MTNQYHIQFDDISIEVIQFLFICICYSNTAKTAHHKISVRAILLKCSKFKNKAIPNPI